MLILSTAESTNVANADLAYFPAKPVAGTLRSRNIRRDVLEIFVGEGLVVFLSFGPFIKPQQARDSPAVAPNIFTSSLIICEWLKMLSFLQNCKEDMLKLVIACQFQCP